MKKKQQQQQQQNVVIDAVLIDSNMPRMNGPGEDISTHTLNA